MVSSSNKKLFFSSTFIVCSLGYFVDVYDLVLFGIVRVQSLQGIGVPEHQLLEVGIMLINFQMAGLLIGGVLWGILGDKKGRVSALLASILLYSLANIANAFVSSVPLYAILRFLAGLGLAGEVGAAITLISEILPPAKRALGTTLLTSFGISGAVVAGLIGGYFQWQIAYLTGGLFGLLLLVLRVSMQESLLFKSLQNNTIRKGDLRLFLSPSVSSKYLFCILSGIPTWYIVGILMTFSPELSKLIQVQGDVAASTSILFCYLGICIGDLCSGFLSHLLHSRRKVALLFLVGSFLMSNVYLFSFGLSVRAFYLLCLWIGFFAGYWAIFAAMTAETFGTNLRVTAVSTATNIVRGFVIVLTLSIQALKPHFGLLHSVIGVGGIVFVLAGYSLFMLSETFGKRLDFVE